MIIDCISELHGHYPQLEGGDLLIVAGDCTGCDDTSSQLEFLSWIQWSKYTKKILVAGNHDNWLQKIKNPEPFIQWGIEYLRDSGTEFEGLCIWGSPWTLRFEDMNPDCMAFTCETEEELAEKWALIPDDIDILVTHSPVWGMGDLPTGSRKRCGSTSLLRRMNKGNLSPKLHCFGHIHEGYGICASEMTVRCSPKDKLKNFKCKFINASHVNERYEPVNKPIRIEL